MLLNHAAATRAWGQGGGAISMQQCCNVSLNSCRLVGNTAGSDPNAARPILGVGGAIKMERSKNVKLHNCVLTGNAAQVTARGLMMHAGAHVSNAGRAMRPHMEAACTWHGIAKWTSIRAL